MSKLAAFFAVWGFRTARFSDRLRLTALFLHLVLLSLTPVLVGAATLELSMVERQAVERSFSLKIADCDIALSKIEEKEVFSLYFPTFALRYDLGYAWALDSREETVTIGDAVSTTDLSTWRNSFSLSASLLLFDGGAREQKLIQARHGLQAAELARVDQIQQVRLQVLAAYLQGLQSQSRASVLGRIVEHRKRLFRVLERLQEAGAVGRARLQDAALELAASLTRREDAQLARHEALAALSALTGKSYQEPGTLFAALPLPMNAPPTEVPVERLPQIMSLDEELARLQAQRSSAWRGMFPLIGFYGNYRLYGSDPVNGARALEDLSSRDAAAALVVQWEFSGFRARLQVARLDEQLRRLGLQRRQRIAELEQEIDGLRQAADLLPAHLEHLQIMEQTAAEVAQSTERLRSQGLLDTPEALERAVDLLEHFLEAELLRNRQQADALRLEIWVAGLGA